MNLVFLNCLFYRNVFNWNIVIYFMVEDCIFCKIAGKEIPSEVIYENDNFICFPDASPRVEGHCLVVPKKHFVNIIDLPSSSGSELLDAIKNVGELKLKEGFDGFNVIQNNGEVAGQVVMHCHFHLLPRKKGDGHEHYCV
jgi:histidine triad (HIT) family protein